LKNACPLKESIAEKGFDVMMVRELTGGLYFGARKTEIVNGEEVAIDTLEYHDY
jgi:3-isopropylmalate dehydrogenase